jgi:4-diphosphocytidyl-2-C-methyl-D-erythritol kinase
MPDERSATIRSFAKLNLDLRVLYKRADNYHELRTVFQTISLDDTIRIRYRRARRTRLSIEGNVDIPNNLIVRAAQAVLDQARIHAEVTFELDKNIPMGAGLGGGSSNAAAILLALPVLAGVRIPLPRLVELGTALGSDVPFFLYGGTAAGIGRGTELYPLADLPARHLLVVAPGIHVSTADAYRDLNRTTLTPPLPDSNDPLTKSAAGADTEVFGSLVWQIAEFHAGEDWKSLCSNDFERAVFQRHPTLRSIKTKLARFGARPALMTGSGSALFGLFESLEQLESAAERFVQQHSGGCRVFRTASLKRSRYRSIWRRQLEGHITTGTLWPPCSRYSKP